MRGEARQTEPERDSDRDIPRIAGQVNGGRCRPERGARSVSDVTTQAVRRPAAQSCKQLERREASREGLV